VNYYMADIKQATDYSPFGAQLYGRTLVKTGAEIGHFGYQGSEMDNEVKGNGNSYTTHFRQLDPRLGRWLSIDPKATAWESPYVSMGNNPIGFNDKLGDSIISHFEGKAAQQVMMALMKTRLGRKYVGNYAAAGQTIGGHTFEKDGKYHKKGVDIHLFDQSGVNHQGLTNDGSSSIAQYHVDLGPAGLQSNGRYRININLNTDLSQLDGGRELDASNQKKQYETNPELHKQIWNKFMVFHAQTFLHELLIHTELSALDFIAGKTGGLQARENDHLAFGRRAYKSVKWTVNTDGSYKAVLLVRDFSTPYLYDSYNIAKELHKMYNTGAKDSEIYHSLLWGLEGIEQ
jgi:RHS repeat-associated protein